LGVGDWIFTVLAWLLLALGVLGLAWALLWDRSRGRKRCPKCWYVVDGVPEREGATTCPECGKVVRKARKLRKTRRRWRFAFLAVLVLVGSLASSMYPSVRDHGWHPIFARSPDLVLIALVPWTKHFNYTDRSFSGEGNYLEPHVWGRLEGTQENAPELASWRTGRLNDLEAWLLRRTAPMFLENPGYERHPLLAVNLMVAAHRGHLPELPVGREIEAVACMAGYAYVSAERFQGGGVVSFRDGASMTRFTVVRERGRAMRHDEAVVRDGRTSVVPNAVYLWLDPNAIDPTSDLIEDESLSWIISPHDNYLGFLLQGVWGELHPEEFNRYAGIERYCDRPCHVLVAIGEDGTLHQCVWVDVRTNFVVRDHSFDIQRDARYLLPDTGPLPDTNWATDPAASPLPAKLDAIDAIDAIDASMGGVGDLP
jgi:hypothetical protein